MKKKMVICCVLMSLVFLMTPLVSAVQHIDSQSLLQTIDHEQSVPSGEKQGSSIRNGYLLFLVFVYTPGQGVSPCAGANITARSLLHRYNGTTDSSGACVLKVKAPLLRERVFFIRVSIVNGNGQTRSRIALMSMKAWHLAYRLFLFADI